MDLQVWGRQGEKQLINSKDFCLIIDIVISTLSKETFRALTAKWWYSNSSKIVANVFQLPHFVIALHSLPRFAHTRLSAALTFVCSLFRYLADCFRITRFATYWRSLSTVVKHPHFYYVLTTIDGCNLPHFARFPLKWTPFGNCTSIANYRRIRQNTALFKEIYDWLRFYLSATATSAAPPWQNS